MYQNIYFDIKKQQVHIWDDEKGYYVIPYKRYAYVRDRGGTHISLYGDRLRKVYKFEPNAPNLFESDVPPETRVLVDQYKDSEELSKMHPIIQYHLPESCNNRTLYCTHSQASHDNLTVHEV